MISLNKNKNPNLDTSASRYIKLQIQYGSELYELLLSSKDHPIQIEHVLNEIEKLTKVPKCHQSVMYKGQRLDHQPKANLDDLYIFNNSKLILTGTQKQIHDKYCCPDHDHQIVTNTLLPKFTSEDKSNKTKTSTPLITPEKQDFYSNLVGFIPEANKNYEYYTVPYKTDPTTLFQTIPPSTSTTHSS